MSYPIALCGAAPDDPASLYYLDEVVGEGGQAKVWRGHGPGPDGPVVAVRVWRPTEGDGRDVATQQESWLTGAQLLGDLAGEPGLNRSIGCFRSPRPWAPDEQPSGPPVPVQVLEWIDGANLVTALAREQELDGVRVLHGLARALVSLSRRGPIVHQDVEPSNVMVTTGGEVVLIDFTSARYERHITHVVLTDGYAAPGLSMDRTSADDVHGFGGVAFYLLTGEAPGSGIIPLVDGTRVPAVILEHLGQLWAENPADRLTAARLRGWTDRLADLVRATGHPTPGVTWAPAVPRQFGPVREQTAPLNGTAAHVLMPGVDPWADPSTVPIIPDGHAETVAHRRVTEDSPYGDLEALRRSIEARPEVEPPAPPAAGTTPVLLLPGYAPNPPAPRPAPVFPAVPVPVPAPAPAPAPTRVAPPPHLPETRAIVDSPEPVLTMAQEYLQGIEYAAVPAASVVGAWAVWILGSRELGSVGAYGGLVVVLLAGLVLDLAVQFLGVRVLLPRRTAWRDHILFWRLLHVPAGLLWTAMVLTYAFLLRT
ncbi:hypothetical protein KOI35_12835 [Actinoplanes bogorensis]|uniref:non-specific serine/threonine protein kinase n=1 Tax=Paractinoplanes bogorensis TaxID=1610840 RepID=A0ABS5YLS2_9ACTN|nr:hypothetical protein [Actinoplanes bogorensis]MBU2664382.1 hypothetical protein [Actinoplanes bogorensis]